jgi:hypothetical protein
MARASLVVPAMPTAQLQPAEKPATSEPDGEAKRPSPWESSSTWEELSQQGPDELAALEAEAAKLFARLRAIEARMLVVARSDD